MIDNDKVTLGRQILQGKKRTLKKQLDFSRFNPEWVGTFVFHYPSLFDQMQIGVAKARMLAGVPMQSVDPLTDNIAHMVATLNVVLDSAPDWFKVDELDYDDYEMLDEVYETYASWRESFRKGNQQSDHQGDSQGA